MSRKHSLSIDRGAELLSAIFPGKNWTWFLSKNLHGLTDSVATIPFDHASESISYDVSDLERFAVQFGRGTLSEEEIAKLIDTFLEDLDQRSVAVETSCVVGRAADHMLTGVRTDLTGHLIVSPEGCGALLEQLGLIEDVQAETARTLSTLAYALRMMGTTTALPNEIEGLRDIAIAQAGRACENAVDIRMLTSALANRQPVPDSLTLTERVQS